DGDAVVIGDRDVDHVFDRIGDDVLRLRVEIAVRSSEAADGADVRRGGDVDLGQRAVVRVGDVRELAAALDADRERIFTDVDQRGGVAREIDDRDLIGV